MAADRSVRQLFLNVPRVPQMVWFTSCGAVLFALFVGISIVIKKKTTLKTKQRRPEFASARKTHSRPISPSHTCQDFSEARIEGPLIEHFAAMISDHCSSFSPASWTKGSQPFRAEAWRCSGVIFCTLSKRIVGGTGISDEWSLLA
jgi:hypothetical protein